MAWAKSDWQWDEGTWKMTIEVYGYEKIIDLNNALDSFAVISDHSIEFDYPPLWYSKLEGLGPGWMCHITLHCFPPGDWNEEGGEEARANIPDISESLEEAFGVPSDIDLMKRWKKYSSL